MKMLITLVAVCAVFVAEAFAVESKAPDFASMDQATLAYLAQQQHDKIEMLKAEIGELKAKIAGDHGGTDAVVVGDVTAVDDGTWVVVIQSVAAVDTTAYEAEIDSIRRELSSTNASGVATGIDARLAKARENLQKVLARGKYKKVVRHDGTAVVGQGNPNGYRDAERREADAAVRKLEREKKAAERKIMGLERRIEVEKRTTTAQGVTDDGVPLTLTAKGVYAEVGRSLEAGKTYTVTGRGQFNATSGEITIKTAVEIPTEDAVE